MLRPSQRGLTLSELLVGLAVGMIVLTGVTTSFLASIRSSAETLATNRLTANLHTMMDLMVRDIRRAGYAARPPTGDTDLDGDTDIDDLPFDGGANPFTQILNADIDLNLTVGNATSEAATSCITYAYNLDSDVPPAIGVCRGCSLTGTPYDGGGFDTDNVEMFGFRLKGQTVQTRTGRAGPSDNKFNCNDGHWEQLSEPELEITGLSFALNDTCIPDLAPASQILRTVDISLTGRLATDPAVQATVSDSVRVRNDQIRMGTGCP
jgi:type IV pilus assembly protein PilW